MVADPEIGYPSLDEQSSDLTEGPFRLAPETELLGPYPDSGYREPPMLARRADGHVVQLPPLLYAVTEAISREGTPERISEDVATNAGVRVDAGDIPYLIAEKLVPLGIVEPPNGAAAPTPATGSDPLLALRLRTKVVPDRVVHTLTTLFRPFFMPLVVAVMVTAVVAFDVWLFGIHGIAQSARSVLETPVLMLVVFACIVVGAALHEIGHATGSRYGGAMPGAMGVGIYIVWPAFYTDISASHTLPRRGRLRADLGGIYFTALASIAVGTISVLTGFEALLIVVLLLQFEMARQLLPLLRLDGYYVVSDLVGVPDLFGRIGPILMSFLPGRKDDPRVTQLKPWVRAVVSIWVVAVVVFVSYYTIFLLLALPRLIGTGWQSFVAQWHAAGAAIGGGAWAAAALAILQLFILAAPAAGMAYMIWNVARRWLRWWQALSGRPLSRAVLAAVTAVALAFLGWAWWPKADTYAPIGPDERWIVSEVGPAISHLRSERGTTFGSNDTAPASGSAPAPMPAASQPSTDPTAAPSPATTAAPSLTSSPSVSPSSSASPSVSAKPSVSTSVSPATSPSP